jgi:hypothetical protein
MAANLPRTSIQCRRLGFCATWHMFSCASQCCCFHLRTLALLQGCHHGRKAPREGWPSLAVIDFTTYLKNVGVTPLGIPSKKASRLLVPGGPRVAAEKAGQVAEDFVGNACFVKCASCRLHVMS